MRRWHLCLLVGAAVLGAAIAVSVLVGVAGVSGVGGDAAVTHARVDRTIVGLVVGAALGLSGAALQGVTQNPLADPGLIGISAGAALAIVLAIPLGLRSTGQLGWVALGGAVVAAAVVYAVAATGSRGGRGPNPVTLVLAGAAVTALVTSVSGALLMTDRATFEIFRSWQVGSVAGRSPSTLLAVAWLLVPGAAAIVLSARALDSMALGEDVAQSLGRRLALTRAVVIGGAVATAAAATAVAGPIAFVGLVVPHLARAASGPTARLALPMSAVTGAAMVVLADTMGRVVMPPSEVQAGIICAVLGAPALLLLVRGRRGVGT